MYSLFIFINIRPPPSVTLFPYTTLFRSISTPWPASVLKRFQNLIWRVLSPIFPCPCSGRQASVAKRSEEHTSELQSHSDLVCRLLLEKKNQQELQLRRQDQHQRLRHYRR